MIQPIVDTHQHLWDLERLRLPWLADAPSLQRSYRTPDYLAATAGLGVVKAVYMEVDVAPEQQAAEAEMLIDLCAQPDTPTVAAVISGRPATPEFEGYIRHFASYPAIVGVRQVLHVPDTPRGHCLTPDYVRGVRLLGALGLSFDICLRPADLGDAVELARRCPETRFVIDHCGNGDPYVVAGGEPLPPADPFAHSREQWMEDMAALAALPNTICKISGIIARTRPGWTAADLAPAVNHCLDSFGFGRVVFGGDWPVCNLGADSSYAAWVTALKSIVARRSSQEQAALFHDNALDFYGLR
ncbi:MAG: amidohydrolase family protein [Caldilineaceae bacterium]|nr:amidohydrolase family protein [Caldilineaceae bacterium]